MPYGHRSHQLGLDADVWLTHQPKGKRDRDEFFPRFVNLKTEKINQKIGILSDSTAQGSRRTSKGGTRLRQLDH